MKEISSAEDAYQAIGLDVHAFPNGRRWDVVRGAYKIFDRMVSCQWVLESTGNEDPKWADGTDRFNEDACRAVHFLRDDLLRTTGQRIWGLTFTLYPSGQFNIEYDYNKPADYEDSDETISLAEALQGLGVDVQVAGLPPKAD